MKKMFHTGVVILLIMSLTGCGDGSPSRNEVQKRERTAGTAQAQEIVAAEQEEPRPDSTAGERQQEALGRILEQWTAPEEKGMAWRGITVSGRRQETVFEVDGFQALKVCCDLVQVTVPGQEAAESQINRALREDYAAFLDETRSIWEDNGRSAWKEAYGGGSETAPTAGWSEEVSVSYLDKVQPRYLTLRQEKFSYYGGVHPITRDIFLVFDLETGALLKLTDIFEDPQTGKKAAADWINAYVKGSEIEEELWGNYEATVAAEVVTDGKWFLTDDGVAFYADPYTLACYASGPKEFVVPYEELASYLTIEF